MSKRQIKHVLIIDDSSTDVFLTTRMLEKEHVEMLVKHFSTPEAFFSEAQDSMASMAFDSLIVVDYKLPSTSGAEVIAKTRKIFKEHTALVIGCCTGLKNEDVEKAVSSAGGDFTVDKPFDLKSLQSIAQVVPSIEIEFEDRQPVKVYNS